MMSVTEKLFIYLFKRANSCKVVEITILEHKKDSIHSNIGQGTYQDLDICVT